MLKRLWIVLFTSLMLMATTYYTAYAGETKPDTREPVSNEDVQITFPDSEKVAEAQAEKLFYLPLTSAQNDRWEQEFERQMMDLRTRLTEQQLRMLDIDALSAYLDLKALQQAAGIQDLDRFENLPGRGAPVNLETARHGDFLLGHSGWRPWGYWNHAGMWDAYTGWWKTVHARGYGWGVRRDAWDWFPRHYSRVAVMGVWTGPSIRNAAGWYARAQIGEPYTIWTSKTNQSKWYCSKLVWAGYYWNSNGGIDLDSNGGFWVTPNNLWYSGWTYIRSIGDGW